MWGGRDGELCGGRDGGVIWGGEGWGVMWGEGWGSYVGGGERNRGEERELLVEWHRSWVSGAEGGGGGGGKDLNWKNCMKAKY